MIIGFPSIPLINYHVPDGGVERSVFAACVSRGALPRATPTADSGYTRRRVSMGALLNTGRVAMSPKAVTPRPPPAMP